MCASLLEYKVEDWSSYASDFSPLHILEDRPFDQKSRWLSDGTQPPQFVVVKLTQPAILHSIKFGKYERSHQCNIRRLKIYGGMTMDKLHLLYEGGLMNTPHPETLSLQHLIDGKPFPCAYVKIVPLQSWGNTFSYSIWYLELLGEGEPSAVADALTSYNDYREKEALRLCLKHLRQKNFTDAFEAVQKKSRVSLEHPLLTQLHRHLVVEGDFEQVEQLMKQCIEDGYLDRYVDALPLEAVWREVKPVGVAGAWPIMRGAHQMTFDPISQRIYLHGGWDGSKDLGDLWTYSVMEGTWQCLCKDSSVVGGPCPRSCHRMCLDQNTQILYFLGCYIEVSSSNKSSSLSDFYCYHIDSGSWKKLSSDTAAEGGPGLLFDHQMCFSAATQSLYVFGGRVISLGELSDGTYGGLYVYHVPQHEWVCLQPDCHPSKSYAYPLVPRSDHTLLFNQGEGMLYVAGGDRGNQALRDMLTYNVQSDEATVVADGQEKQIPECGRTVQSCLDEKRQEIMLMTTFHKVVSGGSSGKSLSPNPVWIYHIHSDKWLPVQQVGIVPCPRSAHQLVYDAHHDTYYMFGGNSGDSSKGHHSLMRLDDLWTMKITRHDRAHVLKHCQLLIRRQRFSEMSCEEPSQAVQYLQTKLSALVDHDNPIEREQFQQMTAQLFSSPMLKPNTESVNLQRNEIYSKLCAMFPSDMTQPSQSISDMIDIVTQ